MTVTAIQQHESDVDGERTASVKGYETARVIQALEEGILHFDGVSSNSDFSGDSDEGRAGNTLWHSTDEARPVNALILVEDDSVGNQVASFLNDHGWRTQVVYSDREAYQIIHQGDVDSIIVDIESRDIGGLAVMIRCRNYRPSLISYAICRKGQRQVMQIARNFGGCMGYFYLLDGKPLQIDSSCGLAARFSDAPVTPESEARRLNNPPSSPHVDRHDVQKVPVFRCSTMWEGMAGDAGGQYGATATK